jgi:hypothetical protein
MATKPPKHAREFGTRRPSVPVVAQPGPPAKRSGHVGLLLMGTLAVGGGAFALMPRSNCEPSPNVAQPSLLSNAECPPRGSSGSGHGGSGGGRSYFSSGSSSSQSVSGTSDSGSSHATRGGFGSFAHAFGFSGG